MGGEGEGEGEEGEGEGAASTGGLTLHGPTDTPFPPPHHVTPTTDYTEAVYSIQFNIHVVLNVTAAALNGATSVRVPRTAPPSYCST